MLYEIVSPTAVHAPPVSSGSMLSQNYPNPASGTVTIEYTLERKSWAVLMLTDLLGRRVATLLDKECDAGIGSISVDVSTLPPGLYVYTIVTEWKSETRTMGKR